MRKKEPVYDPPQANCRLRRGRASELVTKDAVRSESHEGDRIPYSPQNKENNAKRWAIEYYDTPNNEILYMIRSGEQI